MISIITFYLKINKTITNLERYYFSNGWFDRKIDFKVDTIGSKKAKLTFEINTGDPYHIGSISEKIESPVIDSLYKNLKSSSKLKKGDQFLISNFEEERSRLTTAFRNLGAFHFTQDYIRFENDTIGTEKKVDVTVQIQNRIIRNDDSIVRVPFQIYKIQEVNIFTDATFENRSKKIRDDRHGPTSWISITLNEGKFRQVRKMTSAVGYSTLRLVRVRVGHIQLESMGIGDVVEVVNLDF